ncbi:hypothetical protein C8039_17050 [Halogeometricum sp. wsp3]|nr:hypothetical protein C8039_17050 [Halogeometricum sp. wsp3]
MRQTGPTTREEPLISLRDVEVHFVLEGSDERPILAALALVPGVAGISYRAIVLVCNSLPSIDIGRARPGTRLGGDDAAAVGFIGYTAGASRRAIFGVMAETP